MVKLVTRLPILMDKLLNIYYFATQAYLSVILS